MNRATVVSYKCPRAEDTRGETASTLGGGDFSPLTTTIKKPIYVHHYDQTPGLKGISDMSV